ncbi:hypothetical protein [Streptomyces sp. DH12]|nr:hypothetical protein [Streptomyces sp. DH12]
MQRNHHHRPTDGNSRFHRLLDFFTRRRIMMTNGSSDSCRRGCS